MEPTTMTLHAMVFAEADRWVARCVEYDFFADGPTLTDAVDALSVAITIHVEADEGAGRPLFDGLKRFEGRTADDLRPEEASEVQPRVKTGERVARKLGGGVSLSATECSPVM